jgi:DNA polymerase III epsilon subunit-like protein
MKINQANPILHNSYVIMIFDVETNGLLNMKNIPRLDDCPYILQLSYVLYDVNNKRLIKTFDTYIKIPEYISVSPEVTKINGITKQHCQESGYPMLDVLCEFYKDYHRCLHIIAHNYKFDSAMLNIEFQRYWPFLKTSSPYALNLFQPVYLRSLNMRYKCTMMDSTEVCKLAHPTKPDSLPKKEIPGKETYKKVSYKWPTLTELYKHLFGIEPTGMHNSMMDVLVTLRCHLLIDYKYTYNAEQFEKLIKDTL